MADDWSWQGYLQELALKQLGSLPGDENLDQVDLDAVPVYLTELKEHIRWCPDDINFRIVATPNTNYGTVWCLEHGCQTTGIPLTRREDLPEGGLGIGIGSLAAYRTHAQESVLHQRLRDERVSKELGFSPNPEIEQCIARVGNSEQASSSAALPVPSKQTTRTVSHSGIFRPYVVKTEPTEPALSRKRSAEDTAAVPIKAEWVNTPQVPELKRVKLEPPKSPLALANRQDGPSSHPVGPTTPSENSVDDTRTKLSEVQQEISNIETKLQRAERKLRPTKADFTRIHKFRTELASLKLKKEKYNAALPSIKPLSRTGSGARPAESSTVTERQQGPIASGSGAQSLPVPPAFHNPVYTTGRIVSAPGVYNNVGVNLVQYQRPPVYLPLAVPVVPMPIASGSNYVRQPPAPAVPTYEDEGDSDGLHNALDDMYVGSEAGYSSDGIPAFEPMMAGIRHYGQYADDERFDEDGDFFGRGKDTFLGPVAKADDINTFLVAAGNSELFDGNASIDQALAKLGLKDLYTPLPGMEVALMPHQAIGVAWMLDMERGRNKGGILADEMGLGKTVQMIAAMVLNQPAKTQPTLVVCMVALLSQWNQEIELKTNLGLKCLIYHGTGKVKRAEDLKGYDVVLTTYHTLISEYPEDEEELEKKRKKNKKKHGDDWLVDDEEGKRGKRTRKTNGPLFDINWYVTTGTRRRVAPYSFCDSRHRIILDEAQNIRNRRTRFSRAVTKLDATYRWCLTGTPIVNGLADAYGLIRFLRIRPWYDWQEFNERITILEKRQPKLATDRLQTIFRSILLRRKKDSMLDGKRLIELPNKQVNLVRLEFTKEERDIYTMVESKSQEVFNRYLRAGTVLKNYHQVLVLLLRLRQICAHPCLITESGHAFALPGEDPADHSRQAELARAQRVMGIEFVLKWKQKFMEAARERMIAEKQSSEDAALAGEDIECPICFDSYTDPVLTGCGHSFCRECIVNYMNGAQNEEGGAENRNDMIERPCPACRDPISLSKLFSHTAFEPSDAAVRAVKKEEAEDLSIVDEEPRVGRLLRKRRSCTRSLYSDYDTTDDDDLSDFIVPDGEDDDDDFNVGEYRERSRRKEEKRRHHKGKGKARAIILSDDEDGDVICGAKPDYEFVPPAGTNFNDVPMMPKFVPSTKMKYMMDAIKGWAESHPDEKVLVISQWTSCLQLVSDYLTENKVLHVKYQGDMDRTKRDHAVKVFMAKDLKATIMLMSMKCGGVGLNLTRANRVISLDLGWSEAVESQAFDRVHRLGQSKEVLVQRVVIENTVEDRILALQERKKALADFSLGEGTGKKLGKMSVKELANLFGLNVHGERV